MKVGRNIRTFISAALLLGGIVMLVLSFRESRIGMNTETAARRLSRTLEHRMAELDSYVGEALNSSPEEWMDLGGLPQDMVVYRYCKDTLQSWCNEFPVDNDDIRNRFYVPFIANPRRSPESPLLQVEDSVGYVNIGPKWYLAKSVGRGDVKVIAGLEIVDMQKSVSGGGVNVSLHLRPEFSVLPLSSGGGAVVTLGGRPQFELLRETLRRPATADTFMLWLALLLLTAACLVYLSADRSVRRLVAVFSVLTVTMLAFYLWGWFIRGRLTIFSPVLYAGGDVLYSLGAVLIINLWILVSALCVYMCRESLSCRVRSKTAALSCLTASVALVVGVLFYTQATLRSIILNSGISLELYKFSELSFFGVLIYASFITMLVSVPLLIQSAQKVAHKFFGFRFDAFSINNRIFFLSLIHI